MTGAVPFNLRRRDRFLDPAFTPAHAVGLVAVVAYAPVMGAAARTVSPSASGPPSCLYY